MTRNSSLTYYVLKTNREQPLISVYRSGKGQFILAEEWHLNILLKNINIFYDLVS